MVLGEHEDLRLPGQAPEGGSVEDAVAVALEARPPRVGLLDPGPVTGARGAGGALRQEHVLELLALLASPGGGGRSG